MLYINLEIAFTLITYRCISFSPWLYTDVLRFWVLRKLWNNIFDWNSLLANFYLIFVKILRILKRMLSPTIFRTFFIGIFFSEFNLWSISLEDWLCYSDWEALIRCCFFTVYLSKNIRFQVILLHIFTNLHKCLTNLHKCLILFYVY